MENSLGILIRFWGVNFTEHLWSLVQYTRALHIYCEVIGSRGNFALLESASSYLSTYKVQVAPK